MKGFKPNLDSQFYTEHKTLAQTEGGIEQIEYTYPETMDWQKEGKVGKVRQQGKCGSCWAFTIVGMLESAYMIKTNSSTLPNLSEQFLVSCDPGNDGCNGGNTKKALQFLKNTTGMWYEGEFPYNENGQECNISYPDRDLGFPKMNYYKPWIRARSTP